MSNNNAAATEADKVLGSVSREKMLTLAGDLIKIPSLKGQETDVARFLAAFLRSTAIRSISKR